MTEEVSTTETETASEVQQEASTTTKPTETVEFWKKKAREQEARAKANAEAATKLAEFEDRDKTEAQRLAERAEAAERRATELETTNLRMEIAADKGLTPAQAKRLVGATREELEADADELLETFKPSTATEDDTATAVSTALDLGNHGTTTTAAGNPGADFAKFLKQL